MRQFLAAALLLLLLGVPTVLFTDGREVVRELREFALIISGHATHATAASVKPEPVVIQPGIAWLAPLAARGALTPTAGNDHSLDDLQRMAVDTRLADEIMESDPAALDEIQRFALRAEEHSPVASAASSSFPPIVARRTADALYPSASLDGADVTGSASYSLSAAPVPLRHTLAAIAPDGQGIVPETAVGTVSGVPATRDPDVVSAPPAGEQDGAGIADAAQPSNDSEVSAILVRARQYVEGGQVERNYPLAYFWYQVAASRAMTAAVRADAIARRERVSAAMTAEETMIARGLVSDWLEKGGAADNAVKEPRFDGPIVAQSPYPSLTGPEAP